MKNYLVGRVKRILDQEKAYIKVQIDLEETNFIIYFLPQSEVNLNVYRVWKRVHNFILFAAKKKVVLSVFECSRHNLFWDKNTDRIG